MGLRKSRSRLLISSLALIASFTILFSVAANSDKPSFRIGKAGRQIAFKLGAHARNKLEKEAIISGSIQFRLNNEAGLAHLLDDQQNPASSNYHKWLTPTEFGDKFGADPQTHAAVLNWLKQAGIKPQRIWANRLGIEFEARSADVENIFQVNMRKYELNGENFYANEEAPQVPDQFVAQISSIKLHNFRTMKLFPQTKTEIQPNFAAGNGFIVGPKDFYVAYNLKPLFADGIDGTGQTVGIVARTDFDMADVDKYRSTFNLPPNMVVKIPAGGPIVDLGNNEKGEVLLDAQLSGMAAPKAKIQVVIADGNHDIDQSLIYFLNNLPDTKIISISFGDGGESNGTGNPLAGFIAAISDEAFFNDLFKQAAAQGQTVFISSGDDGANDSGDGISGGRNVDGLAASPFVVAVGGTSLTVDTDGQGNATAYRSEAAWNGSGGGLSVYFPRPAYQMGKNIPGETRAVPDISLLADPGRPGFLYVQNGGFFGVGGTSASSPAWAGIFALVNQFGKTNGLGMANSRIYQLGAAQQNGGTAVFHDITQGSNSDHGVTGFAAVKGFDMSTGWGSPDANLFVRNFTTVPDQAKELFLLSPNGGDFLDAGQSIPVQWRIDNGIAAKVTNQDVMLSTDSGKTFQAIATNLSASTRSFNYTPSLDFITGSARFKIVAHTMTGVDIVDSSDFDTNIGTNLRIEFAQYSTPQKRLVVYGFSLTNTSQILINGVVSNKPPKFAQDRIFGTSLMLTGKAKKIGLVPGDNFIVVQDGNMKSAEYKITVN